MRSSASVGVLGLELELVLLTTWCGNDHWYKLLVDAILPARYQSLVVCWVRVAIHVHKERRRHQVRC